MRIAFVADIHARGKDLASMKLQLDALTAGCAKRDVGMIAIAGDVFDRPGIGDQHASTGAICEIICGWAAEITKISASMQVVAIPGNHDLAGSGSRDALHVLSKIKNVITFHEPSVERLCGACFAMVPWMWSGSAEHVIADAVAQAKSYARPGTPIVLVAHAQVIGSVVSGKQCCEAKPGSWQVTPEFLGSLDLDKIALGDFHRRQPFYIGALRQLSHGESGNPTGFEIWDTETRETEWVELSAAPKYKTIVIDDEKRAKSWHILELEGDGAEHIRLRYDGVTPDPVMVRELEGCGAQVQIVVDRAERVRRAEIADSVLSNKHELISLYARHQFPPWEESRIAAARTAYDFLMSDEKAGKSS